MLFAGRRYGATWARIRLAAITLAPALVHTSALAGAMCAGCSGTGATDSKVSSYSIPSVGNNDAAVDATPAVVDASVDDAAPDAGPDGESTYDATDAYVNSGPPTCDPDEASTCAGSVCSGDQSATCTVVPDPTFCEFVEANEAGAAVHLACGQTAKVILVNCGACDSVWVDLYFDGTNCWQSVYNCTSLWLDSHPPSPDAAVPSFDAAPPDGDASAPDPDADASAPGPDADSTPDADASAPDGAAPAPQP